MKNKIIGLFICMLFILTTIPIAKSISNKMNTTPSPSSSSYELKEAFLFGIYKNLKAADGLITVDAVFLWAKYKDPVSYYHFPLGTPVTFEMYSAYGIMLKKINVLFLNCQLVVG